MTPWTAACKAILSFTISWSLLKLMSIKLVMPCYHHILLHPLLLLPSMIPNIRVFSSESDLHIIWPKYWSIGFSISPSNEIQVGFTFGLTAFHLLDVQGKLKSLLQHYIQFKSISSSVLSLFYCPTLSSVYDYWKTIGLTRWIFVGK